MGTWTYQLGAGSATYACYFQERHHQLLSSLCWGVFVCYQSLYTCTSITRFHFMKVLLCHWKRGGNALGAVYYWLRERCLVMYQAVVYHRHGKFSHNTRILITVDCPLPHPAARLPRILHFEPLIFYLSPLILLLPIVPFRSHILAESHT